MLNKINVIARCFAYIIPVLPSNNQSATIKGHQEGSEKASHSSGVHDVNARAVPPRPGAENVGIELEIIDQEGEFEGR
jgi:hypothetical protein